MKQINELSDQGIGLYLADRQSKVIDPTTVDIECVMKAGGESISFSAKSGVLTNCKNLNGALVVFQEGANKLKQGRVEVEYDLSITDVNFSDGIQTIHNKYTTNISVVSKDTRVDGEFGPIFDVLPLLSVCTGKANIKPSGADEQWIREEVAKYLKSAEGQAVLDSLNYLKNDLGNVEDVGFNEKFNDLIKDANVGVKAVKGGAADVSLSNVGTPDVDAAVRRSNVYKALSSKVDKTHDDLSHSVTVVEEQTAIDWASFPQKFIHARYQFTQNDQTITQVLPNHSDAVTVIADLILGSFTGCKLVLKPVGGDLIAGGKTPLELTENGIQGFLLPDKNVNNYEWYPYSIAHDLGLILSDDSGNVFAGDKNLKFVNSFLKKEGDDVVIKNKGTNYINMQANGQGDGQSENLGIEFPLVSRSDINSQGAVEKQILSLKRGYFEMHKAEGICAKLSSKVDMISGHSEAPYFDEIVVGGGSYVYRDMQTKSIVLQETDTLDPNVTGGTPFKLRMYIEPLNDEIASEEGYMELKVVNEETGDYLLDANGEPIGTRIQYAQDEKIGPELLSAVYMAKGQVKARFEIYTSFRNQVLELSSRSCVLAQSTSKDQSTGLAELAFCELTGLSFNDDNRYYGNGFMNLAMALREDSAEAEIQDEQEMQGDNMFLSIVGKARVAIVNHELIVKDNGNDLPVFSVGMLFNESDTEVLRGKDVEINATLIDKENAFEIALLQYKGSTKPTLPILSSFSNQQPVYAAGWTEVSKTFISEDAVLGSHKVTHTFTLPIDQTVKNFAILFRAEDSQTPTELHLSEFYADIKPAFHEIFLSNSSKIKEAHLAYKKDYAEFWSYTPSGYSSFRYTVNKTATKMPWGEIHIDKNGASKLVKNDRSWNTAGNKWICEGDGEFDIDTEVEMQITAKCYVGESVPDKGNSLNSIWLAKNNGDGTFTEVPGSKKSFTLQKTVTTSVIVRTAYFHFNVKKGEKYRIFAQSSIDDGMYLRSGTDKKALLSSSIQFKEVSAQAITILEDGKPIDLSKYEITLNKLTGVLTAAKK